MRNESLLFALGYKLRLDVTEGERFAIQAVLLRIRITWACEIMSGAIVYSCIDKLKLSVTTSLKPFIIYSSIP